MSVLQNSLGAVFEHIADVIEGGNAYALGAYQKGIAGTRTHDPDADVVAVNVGLGSSTTSVVCANTWATDRWVKTTAAPWFLLCADGEVRNIGAARKVVGWSASAITVAPGFPVAPSNGDEMVLREASGASATTPTLSSKTTTA